MNRKMTIRKCLAAAGLLGGVLLAQWACSSGAANLCAKVTCKTGQYCDSATGKCVVGGLCSDLQCGPGFVCDEVQGCIPGPQACAKVTCPAFQTCNPLTALCAINPAPTTMGAQIDRMGRPLVNTLLTDPFNIVPMTTTAAVKDAYNEDGNLSAWQTRWAPQPYIRSNLAVYDGLDGLCGNQLFADGITPRYQDLADIFANDMLIVNTNSGLCTQYLGVESNPLNPTDCGGRQPSYDVVDVTYAVLIDGLLLDPNYSDGVTNPQTFSTEFPYLNAPE